MFPGEMLLGEGDFAAGAEALGSVLSLRISEIRVGLLASA
jgi:hypothetical protein